MTLASPSSDVAVIRRPRPTLSTGSPGGGRCGCSGCGRSSALGRLQRGGSWRLRRRRGGRQRLAFAGEREAATFVEKASGLVRLCDPRSTDAAPGVPQSATAAMSASPTPRPRPRGRTEHGDQRYGAWALPVAADEPGRARTRLPRDEGQEGAAAGDPLPPVRFFEGGLLCVRRGEGIQGVPQRRQPDIAQRRPVLASPSRAPRTMSMVPSSAPSHNRFCAGRLTAAMLHRRGPGRSDAPS